MSRRTSEANKAILEKWLIEQQLVKEGKGTRDWSKKQQTDILEKGRAYDENGLAFEGQHMKSVEAYPEYQGNPENIQFLTRQEHLEAHGGNWQNPTNWYYDPVTKQKYDFGDGPCIPCKTLILSDSILKPAQHNTTEKNDSDSNNSHSKNKNLNNTLSKSRNTNNENDTLNILSNNIHNIISKCYQLIKEHSDLIPKAVIALGAIGTLAKSIANIMQSTSDVNETLDNSTDNSLYEEDNVSEDIDLNDEDTYTESDNHDTHRSPKEHNVRKHSQRYHTNDGIITREKESYTRGGNKADSQNET